MIWYVIENTDKRKYMTTFVSADILMERGWGNGYVAVPPTHPLHLGNLDNMHGDDITKQINLVQSYRLTVHRQGLTLLYTRTNMTNMTDWWNLRLR